MKLLTTAGTRPYYQATGFRQLALETTECRWVKRFSIRFNYRVIEIDSEILCIFHSTRLRKEHCDGNLFICSDQISTSIFCLFRNTRKWIAWLWQLGRVTIGPFAWNLSNLLGDYRLISRKYVWLQLIKIQVAAFSWHGQAQLPKWKHVCIHRLDQVTWYGDLDCLVAISSGHTT